MIKLALLITINMVYAIPIQLYLPPIIVSKLHYKDENENFSPLTLSLFFIIIFILLIYIVTFIIIYIYDNTFKKKHF
jgi:hypothetical protein